MGERGVIAETQACHDDPFLHGCTYSALSADERASAEERAPEGQTVAVGEGGKASEHVASEYGWLLPLLCDGLVGAILLGILLWLLSRCHNGVRDALLVLGRKRDRGRLAQRAMAIVAHPRHQPQLLGVRHRDSQHRCEARCTEHQQRVSHSTAPAHRAPPTHRAAHGMAVLW